MRCFNFGISVIIGTCLVPIGCAPAKTEYKTTEAIKATASSDHDHGKHQGGHMHYGAGPHGGTLIELGGDDFHAELVINHEQHALRIFLLKADAKTPLPTKSSEATLTLDKGEKKSLKAVPLEDDATGESSRFELVDEAFFHEFVEKGFLHGDLSVQIGEKVFDSHFDIHFEHGSSKPDHKHVEKDSSK